MEQPNFDSPTKRINTIQIPVLTSRRLMLLLAGFASTQLLVGCDLNFRPRNGITAATHNVLPPGPVPNEPIPNRILSSLININNWNQTFQNDPLLVRKIYYRIIRQMQLSADQKERYIESLSELNNQSIFALAPNFTGESGLMTNVFAVVKTDGKFILVRIYSDWAKDPNGDYISTPTRKYTYRKQEDTKPSDMIIEFFDAMTGKLISEKGVSFNYHCSIDNDSVEVTADGVPELATQVAGEILVRMFRKSP